MAISFLLGYKVLNDAFCGSKTEFALVSRESIDKVFDIYQEYDECAIWSPAQIVDKVKNILSAEQGIRLQEAIKRENTTLGVNGFSPEGSDTLSESAKSLSFAGRVIVIADESAKHNFYLNPRIIIVSPTEFLFLCKETDELQDLLKPYNIGGHYLDYLLLAVFRRDVCQKIKENMKSGKDNSIPKK